MTDRSSLAVWFCLCSVLPASALASDNAGDDVFALGLEQLSQVRVSVASLRDENPLDAPSSVSVFSRDQLRRLGVHSVEALVNFVPGLRADRNEQQNLGYTLSARGRMPGAGVDILLLLDGQRLNDPWSDGATFMNFLLTTDNIRQVEIIRGPGSALYGSNAFAAVINIVTDPDASGARLRIGEDGERDVFVAAHLHTQLAGGEQSFAFHAREFSYDGQLYDTPEGRTRDARAGRELGLRAQLGDVQLSARWLQREADGFYLFGRVSDRHNRSDSEQQAFSASWPLRVGEWDLRFDGHWLRIEQENHLRLVPAAGMQALYNRGLIDVVADFTGGPGYDLRQQQWRLVAHRNWHDQHQFTTGIEYRHEDIVRAVSSHSYDIQAFVDVNVFGQSRFIRYDADGIYRPLGDQGTRDIVGVFAQDRWALTADTDVVIGWRGDHYDDFGSTSNPRLALIHRRSADRQFKLQYGQAFRAPSVRRLSAVNSPVSIGNPALKPETVRTLEMVWTEKTDWLQSTLTAFDSRFEDVQKEVPVGALPGLTTTRNAASERMRGLEWEGLLQFDSHWQLRATWTHLLDDQPAPQRFDRNFGSLALMFDQGDWQSALTLVARGKREHLNTRADGDHYIRQDAYRIWSLNVLYRLDEQLRLGLQLENIGDEDSWDTGSTTTSYACGIPGARRALRAQLEWEF